MRCALFAVLLAFVVVAGSSDDAEGSVIDLNMENFDTLTKSGVWFIKFYAPWCGHCKRLAPVMDEVATNLGKTANIGKVDCDQFGALCRNFDVTGYPTLYLLRDNVKRLYKGGREKRALIDYISAMASDPVQKTTVPELKAVIRNKIVFTAVGVTSTPSWFEAAAQAQQGEANFYTVESVPALADLGVVAESKEINSGDVLVIRDGLPFVFHPDSSPNTKDLFLQFVDLNKFPLLPEVTRSTFRTLADARKRLLVLGVDGANPSAQASKNLFRELSIESSGDFTFSWLDHQSWEKFLEHFGVAKDDLPAVLVLENAGDDGHFVRKHATDKSAVLEFLEAVKKGAEPNLGASVTKSIQKFFEAMAIALANFIADYPILFGVIVFVFFVGMVLLMLSDATPKTYPPESPQDPGTQAQQPPKPIDEKKAD